LFSKEQILSGQRAEIATMWRFTRKNAITEGFHTKMEVLQDRLTAFALPKTIA